MPVMSEESLITADELLRMPPNDLRMELVRGELRSMAPAGYTHGYVAVNITVSLGSYVKTHRLGKVCAAETGFILETDPDTVRAPDVAFVRQERLVDTAKDGFWPGAPDLAVEVISPNDAYGEVLQKVHDWLMAGARMVVVVEPRKRLITVYRSMTDLTTLTDRDRLDGGDVVPGWEIPVAEIFE